MKKILALVLALMLCAALFAGCGNNADTAEDTAEPAAETTDTAEEDAAPAEEEAAPAEEEAPAEEGVTYKVGVLQQLQHVALDAATEGFCQALKDELGDAVEIEVQNAAGDTATCATIANQFVAEDVDLIMANATGALQACVAATDTIPIVGTSVTDYATALDMDDWTGCTGINVTGASDLAPLDAQADMIKELCPDAQTVGVLYCSAEANSKYQVTVITGYLEALGFTVEEYSFADTNDIAAVVTNACAAVDVIYIPTDNSAASATGTINDIALPAGVPIVAGEEGICSGCGIATLSISYYSLGYQAGLMAADILVNGTDAGTVEIGYASDLTKEYVASRCEELGITVPDDYTAIEEG